MSIIIRLQNLPWSANAEDIRQFFGNLIIPDGGVHIVGGEHGDAFIVFGSDEDARQAMMKDGGLIKDVKVKLLLSSRVEMQNVIDIARQQALTSQNLIQTLAAANRFDASSLQLPALLPNMLSALPNIRLPNLSALSTNMPMPTMPTMPTISTLSNIPPMHFPIPPTITESKPENMKPALVVPKPGQLLEKKDEEAHSKSRSRSHSTSRSKSRSRSRSHDRRSYRDKYGKYNNKSRERYRRRDRSRSKDHDTNNSRSRSRDRYRKRSRSRDCKIRDKDYNIYKSKDKRKDGDKNKIDEAREKSPLKNEKFSQKRLDQDARYRSISETHQKSNDQQMEIQNNSDSKSKFKMTLTTLNKQNSNFFEHKENDVNNIKVNQVENKNDSNSQVSETKTEEEKNMNWYPNLIPSPIMPSWMISQVTTESSVTNANAKETQACVTTSAEQKFEVPPVPIGMYPFAQNFPTPPTGLYQFGAFPPAPNSGIQSAMPTGFPMPPIPTPMFNQFQSTQSSTVNNTIERRNESNRKESKEFEEDVDCFGRDRKQYKKHGSYSPDQNINNYENGEFYDKRDGYKSKIEYTYENKSYMYSRQSFDDEDSRSSRNSQEDFFRKNVYRRNYDRQDAGDDRRDNYSRSNYEDSRKHSVYSTYSKNSCLEMRNLPWNAIESDIKKFFSPIPLYDSCIKFQNDNKSTRTRNAYIKFANSNQKVQALKYSGKSINGYRIHFVEIEDDMWEAAENLNVYVEEPYLKISFIPRRARTEDIASAFPKPPDDIVIKKVRNRESFEAYLKFNDTQPIIEALKNKHKIMISEGRVKLEAVRKEIYLLAKNEPDDNEEEVNIEESMPKRARSYYTNNELDSEKEALLLDAQGSVEEYDPQSRIIRSNSLLLKNLPFNVTDKEIVGFFSDLKVSPATVHIMYNAEGKQTGDSFCEFESETDAEIALQKDRHLLKDKSISISVVSSDDVRKAVSAPSPVSRYGGSRSGPPLHNVGYGRHRPSFIPRPPVLRGPFNRPPMKSHKSSIVEGFGKPGCVVSLENVPYKADVNEILEFFEDFDVSKENIIRRFNENGLATGDARVCLKSQNDAIRAARELDGKKINDRTVYVKVV